MCIVLIAETASQHRGTDSVIVETTSHTIGVVNTCIVVETTSHVCI